MKYTSFTRINTLRLYAFVYVNVGRFGLRYLVAVSYTHLTLPTT